MSDQITNAQAQADIEAAGQRMRAATDRLQVFFDTTYANSDLAEILDELRAAAADLYDGGIDYAIDVKQRAEASDETPREAVELERAVANPGRFAIKIKDDATDEEIVALGAALQPGDIVYGKSGPILEVTATGALEPQVRPDDDKPSTPYGVRVFYEDGTMEEIFDIAGVQVADLTDGTFPFGFIEHAGENDEVTHRAGSWDPEGVFVPFEVEKPRIGW